jgi:thiamine biosynthesis lipoprotein
MHPAKQPANREKSRHSQHIGIRLFLLVIILTPLPSPAAELFVQSHPAMGSRFTIYLYARDSTQASAIFEAAFEEVERLEETLSNYRDTSELSRINRLAGNQAVTTDPEVFELLQTALDYSRKTGGAFDITVGPLMKAWGFFRSKGHYPSQAELDHARAEVGWQNVQLDPTHRTVRFSKNGVELDLGAIGKGYTVDRIVSLLREAGIQSALVDAGSSTLYALGSPPGKNGWTVRVPRPGHRDQTVSTVLLRDASLSTSGSYEKFFRLNGRIYCHILNPHTGRPVEGMLQTSVIARDGTTTDALSTSMFVMGPQAGKALLSRFPGSAGLWITGEPASPQLVRWNWPECRECKENPRAPKDVLSRNEKRR